MKITNYQALQNLTDLPSLIRYVSVDMNAFLSVINGNVDLLTNCSTSMISCVFNKANVSYPFAHKLGRLPQGYLMAGLTANMVIFNGIPANTIINLYLQSSAVGTAKVLVF